MKIKMQINFRAKVLKKRPFPHGFKGKPATKDVRQHGRML
jgi:hypothetical protein